TPPAAPPHTFPPAGRVMAIAAFAASVSWCSSAPPTRRLLRTIWTKARSSRRAFSSAERTFFGRADAARASALSARSSRPRSRCERPPSSSGSDARSARSASTRQLLRRNPVTGGCWQPAAGSQTSKVQKSPSLHGSGPPPSHAPAWQLPAPWHASAAGQAVPSGCETLWHVAPARHRSAVHGLPSLQVGSVAATTHPVFGSHAPVRHGPAHWIVLLGTQAPFPSQR